MTNFNGFLKWLCDNVIWGTPMIVLILGAGITLSFKMRFFQITHFGLILKKTVGSLFTKRPKNQRESSVSQFQVISTALAATIGTGNIAGVATALTIGGPGAVFWMWVSAFFSMATAYFENLLGVKYRKKNKKGEYVGGAMYFLTEGLKAKRLLKNVRKPLAFLFAFFCIFASLGMGNMIQVNTVSSLMYKGIFGIRITPDLTAIILFIFIGFVVLGGNKRICKITEKLVPFMAVIYIFGTLAVILLNFGNMGEVISGIFRSALGINSAIGGVSGYSMKKAFEMGLRRGVFSNEAGLGSSVLVGACTEIEEPAIQGMWGIFTVFFDTIIGCSLTAFALLSSGVIENTEITGAALVSLAFEKTIGEGAGDMVSLLTLLFALSTVIGWLFYGIKAAEYLLTEKYIWIYKFSFALAVLPGATLELGTVWLIADIFNGLMAVPNLIGVLALSNEVKIKVIGKHRDTVGKTGIFR